MTTRWEAVRDECQKRRSEAIPKQYLLPGKFLNTLPKDCSTVVDKSGHFTEGERQIINASATSILKNIASKTWTATEVTQAFCKSAAVAQQLTNCLTEVFFDRALERAQFLDDYQAKHNKLVGPLHGLPISVKDSFHVPPYPVSIGLSLYATEPAKEEAPLITAMREMGAILYVKTNVPTGMSMCETINRIWGETQNPWGFSPGGSSGGEGALVSMKGSPLGIGTDLGGSVRMPAGFCGLYGVKPTVHRLSMRGHRTSLPGVDMISATCGPVARSLDDIKLFMEIMTSYPKTLSLDHDVLPMPWRQEQATPQSGRKLRIGIIEETDGMVTIHPPVARALKEARTALEAAGHEVFAWEPVRHKEMIQVFLQNAFYHVGTVLEMVLATGEPLYPATEYFKKAYEHEGAASAKLDAEKQRALTILRNSVRTEFFDRWAATAVDGLPEMDAILTPIAAWAMPPLGAYQKANNFSFTIFANVMDAPATVFPVTLADKNKDPKRDNFVPIDEQDQLIQSMYDPQLYDGVPVCLQLVGKRFQEESLLAVTEVVDNVIKGSASAA